jgi:putative flippase GtrA
MKRIANLKIVKYFAVGGIAAIVNLGIFFIFAKIMGFNYLLVAAISFVIATLVNYQLSIMHVFESGVRFEKKQEIFWVYAISLIGMCIDLATLRFCVDILSIELMLSKIIATGVVFFWNYYARKHFIFKRHEI